MNKLLELARTKIGCGYVLGSQGEVMTQVLLNSLAHWNTPAMNELAKKWIGVQCFDCSGLIVWSLQQLGLLAKGTDYTAQGIYSSLCNPITKEQLRPGDLVFIKPASGGEIDHVGIYADNGQTVEAKGTQYGIVNGSIEGFNVFGRLKFAELNVQDEASMTGEQAIDYLASKGRVDSPDLWKTAIKLMPQLQYVFIKWAKDVG